MLDIISSIRVPTRCWILELMSKNCLVNEEYKSVSLKNHKRIKITAGKWRKAKWSAQYNSVIAMRPCHQCNGIYSGKMHLYAYTAFIPQKSHLFCCFCSRIREMSIEQPFTELLHCTACTMAFHSDKKQQSLATPYRSLVKRVPLLFLSFLSLT